MPIELHVGTYQEAGGKGLQQLRYGEDGGLIPREADARIANASYGTYSARHDLHYLVDERTDGRIGIYRRANDAWECRGVVPSGGAEPCYVAVDPEEQRLAVANYGSGSLMLFDLGPDGSPNGGKSFAASGSGPIGCFASTWGPAIH